MLRIAFLALSQAHQFLHWVPAALRLAREPGVEVTVLSASAAGLNFVRAYDREQLLVLRKLWVPSFTKDTLFSPPKRRLALLMHNWEIKRFDMIITTETTSSLLRGLPGQTPPLIHLKHGAGDREGGYDPNHAYFDLTLVNGAKDKERLISRGLATDESCVVVGYAKFELIAPMIPDSSKPPMALYNPHFDPVVSSWFHSGQNIVRAMEEITDWDFVIAPHVKLKGGPKISSSSPNILIDRGSVRSIDMTYIESASVYIGDVSSQIYEFLQRPRPCIFLNFTRVQWRENENYAHWNLGQVIERPEELGAAIKCANQLQPQYLSAQRAATNRSIEHAAEPASVRQAKAILTYARQRSQVGERSD